MVYLCVSTVIIRCAFESGKQAPIYVWGHNLRIYNIYAAATELTMRGSLRHFVVVVYTLHEQIVSSSVEGLPSVSQCSVLTLK